MPKFTRTDKGYAFDHNGLTIEVYRAQPGNWFGLTGWLLKIGGNVYGGAFGTRRDAVEGVTQFVV